MKLTISVLIISILILCGCAPQYSYERTYGKEVMFHMPETFSTIEAAVEWVHNEIDYEYDLNAYGTFDYWEPPEWTYNSGDGDCEDQALLLMYILYEQMGILSEIAVTPTHAFAVIGDTMYDPTYNLIRPLEGIPEEYYTIPYFEAMYMAVEYHNNVEL